MLVVCVAQARAKYNLYDVARDFVRSGPNTHSYFSREEFENFHQPDWPFTMESFRADQRKEELLAILKEHHLSVKCETNLRINERINDETTERCSVNIRSALGVPTSFAMFWFNRDGELANVKIEFVAGEWVRLVDVLEEDGWLALSRPDPRSGITHYLNVKSGLWVAAEPKEGEYPMLFWNANVWM